MKIAVILSGSGVYDGSEIHESVLTLLAISEQGHEYQCFAPNRDQYHVINHLDGSELQEKRNILIESARIARGNIHAIEVLDHQSFDALVLPGGFGAAKNLNEWAIEGPKGKIHTDIKNIILAFIKAHKPIIGLCMGPTVIAKALEDTNYNATLTVGSTKATSPYDIKAITSGMESIGAVGEEKLVNEISIDKNLKIITAPCYMMDATIADIKRNIDMAIKALATL